MIIIVEMIIVVVMTTTVETMVIEEGVKVEDIATSIAEEEAVEAVLVAVILVVVGIVDQDMEEMEVLAMGVEDAAEADHISLPCHYFSFHFRIM